MRLIDADALKQHYEWWGSVDEETSDTMTYPEAKKIVDTIVDLQPTIEPSINWISDRNPDKYGNYIVFAKGFGVDMDCYWSGGWDDWGDKVLGWLPLRLEDLKFEVTE